MAPIPNNPLTTFKWRFCVNVFFCNGDIVDHFVSTYAELHHNVQNSNDGQLLDNMLLKEMGKSKNIISVIGLNWKAWNVGLRIN